MDYFDFPILIKYSKIEYLKEIQKGRLYMNNLQYFVELEEKTGVRGIGDKLEASQINIKKHKLFIQIEGEEKREIPLSPPPGIIYDQEVLSHPIFCLMYKIVDLYKADSEQLIGTLQITDMDIKDFESEGETGALVITNVGEFLKRVEEAAQRREMCGKYGEIKYRDKRLPQNCEQGIMLDDSFTKNIRFKNQSEFRIELFTKVENHIVLDIGGIQDISFIIKNEDIKRPLSLIMQESCE